MKLGVLSQGAWCLPLVDHGCCDKLAGQVARAHAANPVPGKRQVWLDTGPPTSVAKDGLRCLPPGIGMAPGVGLDE